MEKKTLRKLLNEKKTLVIPGAYDPLTARLAEECGFEAVLAGGYAVSATLLGMPDLGLISADEIADTVRRMRQVISIPIVADIDTGWGGVLNVRRTIKDMEAAGASAVQIEDQVMPKKAGLTEGRQVVSPEDMVARLRAAVDGRSGDMVIIARTDAGDLSDAIDRANLYYENGADVLFIEDLKSREAMDRAVKEVAGPLLAVMVEGAGYPFASVQELQAIGFKVVYYCNSVLFSTTLAAKRVLQGLKDRGTTEGMFDSMMLFSEFNDFIGFSELKELHARYEKRGGK